MNNKELKEEVFNILKLKIKYNNSNQILKNEDLYDIIAIEEHFIWNKRLNQKIPNRYRFLIQNTKTGFISPSKEVIIQKHENGKIFNKITEILNSSIDEFNILSFYRYTYKFSVNQKNLKANLYVFKNPEVEIENKISISFEILRHSNEENKESLQDFFIFRFKNLSQDPYYIYSTEDLSFFKSFKNFHITTSILDISSNIDNIKKINDKKLSQSKNNTAQMQKIQDKIAKDVDEINSIKNNINNINKNLYSIVPEEEISAQSLLRVIKKM